MSFHKNPKYQIPELIQSLKDHGLKHDRPDQLADSFRIGWMAARVTAAPQEGVSGFHEPERLKAWAEAGRQIAKEELAGMSAPESPQPLAPPPGYALVPLEPDREMLVAGGKECEREEVDDEKAEKYRSRGEAIACFKAMVAVAPQPPASALPDTGNVGADAWRGPFWDVARALNCLPSTFPDANAHVLREAKRFAALRCLACNGHGLIGGMTIEGGENHECPDCHGSGAAPPTPGRGMVPMTEERWMVFCDKCGTTWSVPEPHNGKDRCASCTAAHGIKEGS